MNIPDKVIEDFRFKNSNTKERRVFLLGLFKNHIGANNYITKNELLEKVFGNIKSNTLVQKYYLYDMLKRDMKYFRKKTNCFIVFDMVGGQAVYYVPKTMNDIQKYTGSIKRIVKGTNKMMTKCKKAVSEKWYKKF